MKMNYKFNCTFFPFYFKANIKKYLLFTNKIFFFEKYKFKLLMQIFKINILNLLDFLEFFS